MEFKLFILDSDCYPEQYADKNSLLVIDDELAGNGNSELPLTAFRFMTTLLVKSTNIDLQVESLKKWWFENINCDLLLDEIASEISQLAEHRIADLKLMRDETWSLKSSFVAYSRNSSESYKQARQLVYDSELSVQ